MLERLGISHKAVNWLLMILCSVIWGFSYFFIKHALVGFNPLQVATIRAVSAGAVLLPLVFIAFKKIPAGRLPYVFLCAVLGNGIPMFLYPLAQTHISSAVTGIINSLTPLCTYFIAILFFGMTNQRIKLMGVLIGLIGAACLILLKPKAQLESELFYLCMALCAPILYGLNANLLKKFLAGTPALPLTALMYFILLVPALPLFYCTGIPERVATNQDSQEALVFALLLGVFGTAVAMSLFNVLIKRADIMFAASISYLMPVVAVVLGLLDHETLDFYEILGLLFILTGVLMINIKFTRPANT